VGIGAHRGADAWVHAVSEAARWERLSESGSRRSLEVARWIVRRLGRRMGVGAAALAGTYFMLRRGASRRASRRYLERVAAMPAGRAALGTVRPGPTKVLRHFYEISLSVLDRIVVWGGALDAMELTHDGSEEVFALADAGHGALILGAHIGNLDMLGFVARRHDLLVNVVAYYGNAERINAFLKSLGNEQVRVLERDPDSAQTALRIRACLERGEFVVVMADRVAPGGAERSELVRFLGDPARFPLTPFLLAATLGFPVSLSLCVRTGDARYAAVMRPIAASPQRTPRRERDQRARELLARYVSLLEEVCLRYPLQWFNFFDFWEDETP
jgi:predicted LPLAT superfamily acyltransferase